MEPGCVVSQTSGRQDVRLPPRRFRGIPRPCDIKKISIVGIYPMPAAVRSSQTHKRDRAPKSSHVDSGRASRFCVSYVSERKGVVRIVVPHKDPHRVNRADSQANMKSRVRRQEIDAYLLIQGRSACAPSVLRISAVMRKAFVLLWPPHDDEQLFPPVECSRASARR